MFWQKCFWFALKFPSGLQHGNSLYLLTHELSVILVCLNKYTPLKMHTSHIHLERIFETFPSQFCASWYAQYTLGCSKSREGVVFYDKAVNQSERRKKIFLRCFKLGQGSIVLLQPVAYVITAKTARNIFGAHQSQRATTFLAYFASHRWNFLVIIESKLQGRINSTYSKYYPLFKKHIRKDPKMLWKTQMLK